MFGIIVDGGQMIESIREQFDYLGISVSYRGENSSSALTPDKQCIHINLFAFRESGGLACLLHFEWKVDRLNSVAVFTLIDAQASALFLQAGAKQRWWCYLLQIGRYTLRYKNYRL